MFSLAVVKVAADCDEPVTLKLGRNYWSSKALLCLALNFFRLVLFEKLLAFFLKLFFNASMLN